MEISDKKSTKAFKNNIIIKYNLKKHYEVESAISSQFKFQWTINFGGGGQKIKFC